jgi:hypothetical protein
MTNFQDALTKYNVTELDENSMLLECNVCKTHWSPKVLFGGKLQARYWQCPNGSNKIQSNTKVP